jgi:hypothetical protein
MRTSWNSAPMLSGLISRIVTQVSSWPGGALSNKGDQEPRFSSACRCARQEAWWSGQKTAKAWSDMVKTFMQAYSMNQLTYTSSVVVE